VERRRYEVVVIGGGHAGAEAAWAAASLLPRDAGEPPTVAMVTLDPSRIGAMSCNPAIGGLAKGQLVREIDALGGIMGLAADATGIGFKVLNASKGPAVHGPRAQCDRHAYAEAVRSMILARPEIDIIAGSVEQIRIERGALAGVAVRLAGSGGDTEGQILIDARAVIVTTGTFMRGLMHTGGTRTPGGRHGEAPSTGIAASLERLGFEMGRLKTGTPPRLLRSTIRWDELEPQLGDEDPSPFSAITEHDRAWRAGAIELGAFPAMPQVECRQTRTTPEIHDDIRANLHLAPMFSGQIESVGPRYCPSIEDKVVRFADRGSHGVFLEPESLRDAIVYCNGIATSLPTEVQDRIVRGMPGCEDAVVHRYGYAVEYDMVRPHQILTSGMTRRVEGLFLAGQINGTSGYEEAAAQGLIAGLNAALLVLGRSQWVPGRHEAYIGVLMDDLVTKTPVEPYRMFTSRAEHRLLLRADNAQDRLTPKAQELGLLGSTTIGRRRIEVHARRRRELAQLHAAITDARIGGVALVRSLRRPGFSTDDLRVALAGSGVGGETLASVSESSVRTAMHDLQYAPYVERQQAEIRRRAEMESRRLPADLRPDDLDYMRTEAKQALLRYRPTTYGQAGRLEGVTPADLTLLSVLVARRGDARARAG